jgi:UDP-N-acetylglucosamine 2-epimerase (non-hydrolysing)
VIISKSTDYTQTGAMEKDRKLIIVNVVGARPNFIKIAPLMRAYKKEPGIEAFLVHTGQHYDEKMSKLFFEELEIPRPDTNLEVGSSSSQAVQTAEIIKRFEPVVLEYKPDVVVVVGDVNSTIACALVAVKLGVKVAHVEAGLRSFDRNMPEEINRLLTDAISDYLFVTEESGLINLKKEGIPREKIFFVGNVMIDTLLRNKEKAERSTILEQLSLKKRHYALVTLHRPSNVDSPEVLGRLLEVLKVIGSGMPVIFPVHPRTRKNIATFSQDGAFRKSDESSLRRSEVRLIDPIGYMDFLKLMVSASVVITDSGGIQEETTILRVPCLTLRENTERPITVEVGTNTVVGTNPDRILKAFQKIMKGDKTKGGIPELWDGKASERIVKILLSSRFRGTKRRSGIRL